MAMSTSNRLGIYVLGAILLAFAAIQVGKLIGKPLAEDTVERLRLIWPDFMKKPEAERAVLMRAAIKCRLASQPLEADAVKQCLRQGANELRDVSAETEVARQLRRAPG